MGKSMAKSDVIYGEAKALPLSSFSNASVNEMVKIIRDKIGPEPVISLIDMREKIREAQANPKMKTATVKVGAAGSDLVWRAKENRHSGPLEIDAILVKNYTTHLRKYVEAQQKKAQLEQEQKAKLAKAPSRRRLSISSPSSSEDEFIPVDLPTKVESTGTVMGQINAIESSKRSWAKYDLKAVSREDAEAALLVAGEGAWLVRTGSNVKQVVSTMKGGKFGHAILEDHINKGEDYKAVGLSSSKVIADTTKLKKLIAEGVFREGIKTVQAMPGYFPTLSSAEAVKLLAGERVGAWLVRGSGTEAGVVAWSHKVVGDKTTILHDRLTTQAKLDIFNNYIRSSGRLLQVRNK